ncbi:hypothetical protein CR513_43420, partial [Mucuna pruriens]
MEWKGKQYGKIASKGRKKVFFKEGDLFPHLRKSKLLPRWDGQFNIIKKINDNAYKVEMSQYFGGSTSFNVIDLTYVVEDKVEESTPALEGPITRGRIKRIHEEVLQRLALLHSQEMTHEE